MKVRDYVITKDRLHIGKIYNINDFREQSMMYAIDFPKQDDFIFMGEDNFKSSPNIIDLIEVGDVISYKDGSIARVIEIPYTNPNNHKYYLIKDISGEQYYERDEWLLDNIKSIVTKEMFESMEYKVGGKQ